MNNAINFIVAVWLSVLPFSATAQDYNAERRALTDYIVRMYNHEPFEGVRIVEDYDSYYLLSVLTLEESKYTNESVMFRVASVKAMSQASTYFNGANIISEIIIHTSEKSDGSKDIDIIENIKENSIGYVKQLEMLANFHGKDEKRRVFIYFKKVQCEEDRH